MRVISSNSPRTLAGAIGSDLRASFPPEASVPEEIAFMLKRLCAVPLNGTSNEGQSEAKRPQTCAAAR